MSDQRDDVTIKADKVLAESLGRAAHATVSAAISAGDCVQLHRHVALGLTEPSGRLPPESPPPKVSENEIPRRNGSRSANGVDDIIKQYRDSFEAAHKIVIRQGHTTLEKLIADLNQASIRPFCNEPASTVKYWLSRFFGRNNGFRLYPHSRPAGTTFKTEVWTTSAWKNQSDSVNPPIEDESQPGLV